MKPKPANSLPVLAQQSEEPAIGFLATYPTYGHYDALGREIDVTLEIAVTHQD